MRLVRVVNPKRLLVSETQMLVFRVTRSYGAQAETDSDVRGRQTPSHTHVDFFYGEHVVAHMPRVSLRKAVDPMPSLSRRSDAFCDWRVSRRIVRTETSGSLFYFEVDTDSRGRGKSHLEGSIAAGSASTSSYFDSSERRQLRARFGVGSPN